MTLGGVAQAGEPLYDIDVPSMNAAEALNRFAEQTGAIMLFPYDLVRTRRANAVHGRYTLLEGLHLLLRGTELTGGLADKRVVSISQIESATRVGEEGAMLRNEPALGTKIAAFIASVFSVHAARSQDSDVSAQSLEEIIVTAQKREERLQDVPVPVTALSAGTLINTNQLRLQDYYVRIPGLSLTLSGDGATPQVTIRGISAGGLTNPTVSTVIDDVPFGPSAVGQGGFETPDLDPSELARVEVLRGPQGTLYGASSLGGLIKFVTVDPSTEALSGNVQVGTSSVSHSDDMGYNVRGSVNVPISDTWAVRASGFTREEPGYVDNVRDGERDVNSQQAQGGRLAALWRPSDDFSLKLAALVQDITRDGSSFVRLVPALDDLQQDLLPDSGGYDKEIEAYSAIMTAKLSAAELTSLTGYGVNSTFTHLDATAQVGSLTGPMFGSPNARSDVRYKTDKLSQELRLSIPLGERVEWLVGGFYTKERTAVDQVVPVLGATMPVTDPSGAPVGFLFQSQAIRRFEEYAAFSNVTVAVTDRFDIQLGGRFSENEIKNGVQTVTGPLNTRFGRPYSIQNPAEQAEDDAVTYLLTPRFKVSRDFMAYARFASGYRPGGPNANPILLAAAGLPLEYGADTTQNYEVGLKGSVFEDALSFDASVYYIDWKDIQIQLRDPTPGGAAYRINGGRARSQGVELATAAKPLSGLTIAAWVAWNDAELTEDLPARSTAVGRDGDRLPYSSRLSGNLSLDQEFPLGADATAFVGASGSYVGGRKDIFLAVGQQRLTLPSYTQVDLRAGVRYASWEINAFANNVGDERGALVIDPLNRAAAVYIQPRTLGLSLTKSF